MSINNPNDHLAYEGTTEETLRDLVLEKSERALATLQMFMEEFNYFERHPKETEILFFDIGWLAGVALRKDNGKN